jgi:hypothetical protein
MQFATESFVNTVGGIHPVIFWQSTNPVTGGKFTSDILRSGAVARELDPLGSDVTTEPPPDPQSYQPPVYSVPEEPVAKLLDFDANDDIPDWYLNMAHAESDRALAQWFWNKGYRDRAQEILNRNPNVGINVSGNPALISRLAEGSRQHIDDDGSITVWGAQAAEALGVISTPREMAAVDDPADPQNPLRKVSDSERSSLVDNILDVFKKHPGCEEWTNKLLAEMSSSTGFSAGSIRDVLENFRKNGAVSTNDKVKGTGTGSAGRNGVALQFGETADQTAVVLMHEIIHWAGHQPQGAPDKGYYTDAAMATAWNKLGVVMSVAEYRATYPVESAQDAKAWMYDYAESKLASAANNMTCLGGKTGLGIGTFK